MEDIVRKIKKKLADNASEKTKRFWSSYLKNQIDFMGVPLPIIRKIVKDSISTVKPLFIKDIAYALMQGSMAEEKLAAIITIQLFLLGKMKDKKIVEFISVLFTEKLIYDWNTCDWLCVKVLTPIIDKKDTTSINIIKGWYNKRYLWQARASLVSFVLAKTLKDHMDYIDLSANFLINRSERFAKTAVGWILREISKFDPVYIEDFLKINKSCLSREVVNNSLKYFDKDKKKKIKKSLFS